MKWRSWVGSDAVDGTEAGEGYLAVVWGVMKQYSLKSALK